MSPGPATPITTETLAPDAKQGPFRITVSWQLLAERWEAVGMAIEFADESRVRPLQTSDLRALRLPRIVEQAAVELRRQLRARDAELRTAPPEPLSGLAYLERLLEARLAEEALAAAVPRPPGRPPRPLRELEEVARIYADAFYAHEPPTKAVAERFKITYSAAAKRIARCRAVGILGPAERGKASVGALIGRGDAASTRSLIAIKKTMAARHDEMDDREAEVVEKIGRPDRDRGGSQA